MALLEASQADGKAVSLKWKLRSHQLPSWQMAILSRLRGGPQATLGFFSRDSPKFSNTAGLVGPGNFS